MKDTGCSDEGKDFSWAFAMLLKGELVRRKAWTIMKMDLRLGVLGSKDALYEDEAERLSVISDTAYWRDLTSRELLKRDWEVFEKEEVALKEVVKAFAMKSVLMGSFEWALTEMREGAKMRRAAWTEGVSLQYITLNTDTGVMIGVFAEGEREEVDSFDTSIITATDWEHTWPVAMVLKREET